MRVNLSGVVGEFTTMPGCSQVVISHGVFLPKKNRGFGLGKTAGTERVLLMQELGYNYALCTVEATNEAQKKVLEHSRWHFLDSFISSKTEHNVQIWGKEL